jgi:hypothetical protein
MEERSVTQMQVPEPEKISSIKNKLTYRNIPNLSDIADSGLDQETVNETSCRLI